MVSCVVSQKLVATLDGKLALAKEVMMGTVPVRSAIRNNRTEEIYQIIQQSNNEGMLTLEQDLARLYKSGIVSYDEAVNNANNKKRFEDLIRYDRQPA